MARTVGPDRQGVLHRSTSSGPPTSSSRTARRSGPSAGRSRAATRRRPSRRRSPAWPRPGAIAEQERRRGGRPDLPGHRRRLPAQHQELDGHDERPAEQPTPTSSGCRRPATPTRRSPTTSATAARTPTSARSSTRASSSCTRLGVLRSDDADIANSLGVVDQVIKATTTSGDRASTGTASARRAPRTGTATATSATRPTARSRASRGRASAARRARTRGPATSGRCCPVSAPSTRS